MQRPKYSFSAVRTHSVPASDTPRVVGSTSFKRLGENWWKYERFYCIDGPIEPVIAKLIDAIESGAASVESRFSGRVAWRWLRAGPASATLERHSTNARLLWALRPVRYIGGDPEWIQSGEGWTEYGAGCHGMSTSTAISCQSCAHQGDPVRQAGIELRNASLPPSCLCLPPPPTSVRPGYSPALIAATCYLSLHRNFNVRTSSCAGRSTTPRAVDLYESSSWQLETLNLTASLTSVTPTETLFIFICFLHKMDRAIRINMIMADMAKWPNISGHVSHLKCSTWSGNTMI